MILVILNTPFPVPTDLTAELSESKMILAEGLPVDE